MDKLKELQDIIGSESTDCLFRWGRRLNRVQYSRFPWSSDGVYSVTRRYLRLSNWSHHVWALSSDFFRLLQEVPALSRCQAQCSPSPFRFGWKKLVSSRQLWQNIDSLHEMAGSKKVLKLHGSADCTAWAAAYDLEAFLALEGDCSTLSRLW